MIKTDARVQNIINLYPCEFCKKLCYGKECKNCYFRIMKEGKNGICMDCNNRFDDIRGDGTRRKRCLKCRTKFIKAHTKECVSCEEEFFFTENNKGIIIDKCKECYEIYKQENPLPVKKSCVDCKKNFKFNDGKIVAERCKKCYEQFKMMNPFQRENVDEKVNPNTKSCVDCNNKFYFKSDDKTKMAERCKKCYEQFKIRNPFQRENVDEKVNPNMKSCVDCNNKFYFKSDDKTKMAERCKKCYEQFKYENPLIRQNNKEETRILEKCVADFCNNKTYNIFCKKCNETAHEYLVSTCKVCNQRGSGYFIVCYDCKKTKM